MLLGAAAKHQWREHFEQLNRPEQSEAGGRGQTRCQSPPLLFRLFCCLLLFPHINRDVVVGVCELQIKLRQKKKKRKQEEGAQSGGSKRQMANGLFRSAFWLAAPWFLPSFLRVCKSRKAKALLLHARARLSCHFTALHTLQLRAH